MRKGRTPKGKPTRCLVKPMCSTTTSLPVTSSSSLTVYSGYQMRYTLLLTTAVSSRSLTTSFTPISLSYFRLQSFWCCRLSHQVSESTRRCGRLPTTSWRALANTLTMTSSGGGKKTGRNYSRTKRGLSPSWSRLLTGKATHAPSATGFRSVVDVLLNQELHLLRTFLRNVTLQLSGNPIWLKKSIIQCLMRSWGIPL